MFDCLAHERRKPVIADKVVISLASAERRNTTVPKLVDAGFRVLDAIDGRLMSKEEIAERFDTALFEDTFLHYPKPGEIGCTLSHLIAISDFAAAAGGADDWIVITEDDAALSPWWGRDLPRALGAAQRLGVDLAVLGMYSAPMGQPAKDYCSRHHPLGIGARPVSVLSTGTPMPAVRAVNVIVPQFELGSVGYAMTRSAARTIVAYEGKPYWVADDWRVMRRMGLRIGLVKPTLVEPSSGVESTIRHGDNPRVHDYVMSPRERLALKTRLKALRGKVVDSSRKSREILHRLRSGRRN